LLKSMLPWFPPNVNTESPNTNVNFSYARGKVILPSWE
jgi:hypothetical protein